MDKPEPLKLTPIVTYTLIMYKLRKIEKFVDSKQFVNS